MATIIATGNLGQDSELKNANNGTPFLKFSIGDSKSRKKDDGTWEELAQQWLNCTFWGPAAESFADLRKGDRVTVYGEFYARKYEANGEERQSLDVKVHGVQVLKRKDGGYGQGNGGQQSAGTGSWNTSQGPAGAPQTAQWGQQAPAPAWGNPNAAQGGPSPF